jgi:hypothetical protein
MISFIVIAITLALGTPAALAQQKQSDQAVYTLYRDSPEFKHRSDMSQRIHIASFDAAEGTSSEEFNRENCQAAAELLTAHNSAPFPPRFWCERGRFRK